MVTEGAFDPVNDPARAVQHKFVPLSPSEHVDGITGANQLYKPRAVAIGGILKRYIKERERENLTEEPEEEPTIDEKQRLYFGWKQNMRRYRRIGR